MVRSSGSALFRLTVALALAAVVGLLVAALAFPVVGAVGLTAKAGADEFLDLPTELKASRPASTSRVLAADGSLLATFFRVNRVPVAFKDIPLHVRQAVVAVEDSRFYEHDGVDFKGTLRAAMENVKSGGISQGGSTLTQQYVKNALLEEAYGDEDAQKAAQDDTVERKLREARLALQLERTLSKDEILDRYLQIAYYGNGVYGIGTAARYYFDKPVQQLTLAEGALLVGMVQNPERLDPTSRSPQERKATLNRRNIVLGRMRTVGFLDTATWKQATAAKLPLANRKIVPNGCEARGSRAPFFCDHLRYELEHTPVGAALGKTVEERQRMLYTGGLTIRTTLDPKVQRASQFAVDEQVPRRDPSGAITVADVVEPGSGHIKAMAVNRGYGSGPGLTKVNYANGGGKDGFGFQGGSTFKAFALAAALQKGLSLGTTIYSPPLYNAPDCDNGGRKGYPVNNAEADEGGTFDLRRATELSVNTYFIQLGERTGLEPPIAVAESLGVKLKVPGGGKPLERRCSTLIGAQEVSPLAMAGAYAAFAARGVYCPPRATLSITGPDGPLEVPSHGCRQAVEQGIADTVNDVLRGVITNGTGRRADIGRAAAGKTGTTNASRAAWFVGYTPQLAAAVWLGMPDEQGRPREMRRVTVNGQYYRAMYGGNLPSSIWNEVMNTSLEGVEEVQFERPDPEVLARQDDGQGVPDVAGLTFDEAAAQLRERGYTPIRAKRVTGFGVPEDLVARTAPRAGQQVSEDGVVYVYISRGGQGSGGGDGSGQSGNVGSGQSGGDDGSGQSGSGDDSGQSGDDG